MRRAETIGMLILLAPFACASVPAAPGDDLSQRLDSLFDGLPHATFQWENVEGVSERAAIRLPVNLDGTEGWFQLDTGLDVTLVYGDIPTERGWETHDGMYHVPSFEIGGMNLGATWLRARKKGGSTGEVIGSLGLDLLFGYWVIIDYPGRRFALLRPGDAPLWLWQHATWTPAELRNAKLFLYVTLGGQGVKDLIFDTGSSAFDVIVDFDDWTELTSPETNPTEKDVNSWGKVVTVVGAPARGSLIIGSAHIDNPRVYYLKDEPGLFSQWPFPARGLIGNAPFWDRVVIMDLGIRPRLGLLQ